MRFDLLLESARAGIARAKRNVPLLKAKGRIAENIARSADSGIRACLEECCLLLRGIGDKEGARASIRTALDFASEIVDAARRADSMRDRKSHWLYSMNFMHAQIAALMGQSFALASDLAGALRFDAVTEEEGHASDIEPRLYGAAIENDQKLFSTELARYRQNLDEKRSYMHVHYLTYDHLMVSILTRDVVSFEQGLGESERRFASRCRDTKIESTDVLNGASPVQGFSFDVISVALSNLARRRGMEVAYASELVPNDVFLEPI